MTGPAEPRDQAPAWTDEDEEWVQGVVDGYKVDLGTIADVIEESGAQSLAIIRKRPAGES